MFFVYLLILWFFIESFYHLSIPEDKRKNTGGTIYWHLYFVIFSTFYWRNESLLLSSGIYFLLDFVFQYFNRSITSFTIFHHTLALICVILNQYICIGIINITSMHEFSTIFLDLFYLGHIPKPIYNKIFSLSFILCRLVVYNYYIFFTDYNCEISTIAFVLIMLLNLMNIGIVFKMRLLQKLLQ